MKSAKKLIALLLCAVMSIGATACSAETKPSSLSSSLSSSSPSSSSSSEKVELVYSCWGGETELANSQKILDQFNNSQNHIHVTQMPIPWETYMDKLNTLAAAGQLPDVGGISESGVIQWATKGKLLDISHMYDDASEKPLAQSAYTYDGKTVAYASANEFLILYYNKKMFDKAGVAYPPATAANAWTWDEFVAAGKKLTFDKNGKTPSDASFDKNSIKQYGCMVEDLTWQLETWCLSNGGGFYNKTGTDVTIGEPAATEAIQKVADLYLKDHVAPLSTALTDDGVQRSLIAGTCAMTTNGTWNIGTCLADARIAGLDYGIGVLPYMKDKVTINTGGPVIGFNTTKHPQEAMEFIKWFNREENNWDALIKTGIWMPTKDKYYTNEADTKKWLNNPNYPPYEQSKTVLADYGKNNSKQTSWYYVNNTTSFNTLLGSVLGDVWTGKTTAQKAITDKLPALKAAFQGNS